MTTPFQQKITRITTQNIIYGKYGFSRESQGREAGSDCLFSLSLQLNMLKQHFRCTRVFSQKVDVMNGLQGHFKSFMQWALQYNEGYEQLRTKENQMQICQKYISIGSYVDSVPISAEFVKPSPC